MDCPQCGHSNDEEYAFCKKCGASLKRHEAEPALHATPPPEAALTPPAATSTAAATVTPPYGSSAGATPPVASPTPAAIGQATEYAGFWWRFLAVFIDGIITAIPNFFISFMAQMVAAVGIAGAGGNEEGAAAIVSILFSLLASLLGFVISWLYEAGMVSSRYQATLGKMAVGIVVTDMNGGRISFGRATGRYFGRILSAMILFAGYLMQPFTDRRQALHDMLASCLVLRKVARPSTV